MHPQDELKREAVSEEGEEPLHGSRAPAPGLPAASRTGITADAARTCPAYEQSKGFLFAQVEEQRHSDEVDALGVAHPFVEERVSFADSKQAILSRRIVFSSFCKAALSRFCFSESSLAVTSALWSWTDGGGEVAGVACELTLCMLLLELVSLPLSSVPFGRPRAIDLLEFFVLTLRKHLPYHTPSQSTGFGSSGAPARLIVSRLGRQPSPGLGVASLSPSSGMLASPLALVALVAVFLLENFPPSLGAEGDRPFLMLPILPKKPAKPLDAFRMGPVVEGGGAASTMKSPDRPSMCFVGDALRSRGSDAAPGLDGGEEVDATVVSVFVVRCVLALVVVGLVHLVFVRSMLGFWPRRFLLCILEAFLFLLAQWRLSIAIVLHSHLGRQIGHAQSFARLAGGLSAPTFPASRSQALPSVGNASAVGSVSGCWSNGEVGARPPSPWPPIWFVSVARCIGLEPSMLTAEGGDDRLSSITVPADMKNITDPTPTRFPLSLSFLDDEVSSALGTVGSSSSSTSSLQGRNTRGKSVLYSIQYTLKCGTYAVLAWLGSVVFSAILVFFGCSLTSSATLASIVEIMLPHAWLPSREDTSCSHIKSRSSVHWMGLSDLKCASVKRPKDLPCLSQCITLHYFRGPQPNVKQE
ncbi:hypothetical protein KC363_g147 [Hortaea werneckii]|nr:hypothetical protein KC363_g147 [Hortaea werneckii]